MIPHLLIKEMEAVKKTGYSKIAFGRARNRTRVKN
jgi:hypothetical protein